MNRSNINNMRETEMNIENLYPEIYIKFAPIAEQLIKDMERQSGNIHLTEALLQEMTDEAIRRAETGAVIPAGADASDSPDLNLEAVPVLYQFGANRDGHHGGFNRPHWHGYDRGVFSDIFRILFLQQIFGRRRPNWRPR